MLRVRVLADRSPRVDAVDGANRRMCGQSLGSLLFARRAFVVFVVVVFRFDIRHIQALNQIPKRTGHFGLIFGAPPASAFARRCDLRAEQGNQAACTVLTDIVRNTSGHSSFSSGVSPSISSSVCCICSTSSGSMLGRSSIMFNKSWT